MGAFSANLLLSILAYGESTANGFDNWGESANFNFNRLDAKLGNKASVSLTAGDATLSAAAESSFLLELTGTLSADRVVNLSARPGFWVVSNIATGNFSVSFEPDGGTPTVVPPGYSIVYSDGDEPVIVASDSRTCFLANKNGTGQNTGSGTKVTFANKAFDIGGYFDTTNSRWTPKAGKYRVSASLGHGISKNEDFVLHLYKNGVSVSTAVCRRIVVTDGSTPILTGITTSLTTLVEANGTDYFEIFYTASSGGSYSIDGQTVRTWFCGEAA